LRAHGQFSINKDAEIAHSGCGYGSVLPNLAPVCASTHYQHPNPDPNNNPIPNPKRNPKSYLNLKLFNE